MKIVCPNCGKKYNYDKQMGICPSCTKYTSYIEVQKQSSGLAPSVVEKKSANSYSQESIHDRNSADYHGDFEDYEEYPHDSAHSYSQSATNTGKKKTSLLGYIVSIFIAIAMITTFSTVVFGMVPNKVAELREFQELGDIQRESFAVDEMVSTEKLIFTVAEAKVLDPKIFAPPEGWKYVYIPYTIDEEEYSYNNNYSSVYLNVNNMYFESMSEYDLPDRNHAETLIKAEFSKLVMTNTISYYGNCLVFLIPEEEKEYTLCYYEYERHSDYYVDKLIRIMEHPIVEPELPNIMPEPTQLPNDMPDSTEVEEA